MFKYGKKKPQGATRNAPKGSAPAHPQARTLLPGWLLVGFGLALGLFFAFVLYLWQPWVPVRKPAPAVANETPDTPPKDTSDPRFDFYTLLPSQKVTTPGAEQPATTVTPAPATLKPASPDAGQTTPAASPEDRPHADKTTSVRDKDPEKAKEKTRDSAKAPPKKDDALMKLAMQREADAKKAREQRLAQEQAKLKQPKVADTDARYTLQAGSFRSMAEADRRRANIVMSGLPVRVQKVTVKPGEVWYRVVVGPFAGKDRATQARQNLQSDGVDSMMIKQDKK